MELEATKQACFFLRRAIGRDHVTLTYFRCAPARLHVTLEIIDAADMLCSEIDVWQLGETGVQLKRQLGQRSLIRRHIGQSDFFELYVVAFE